MQKKKKNALFMTKNHTFAAIFFIFTNSITH